MKDEGWYSFDGGQRLEGGIRTAVELWCDDPAAAKAQYGPIASWAVSYTHLTLPTILRV